MARAVEEFADPNSVVGLSVLLDVPCCDFLRAGKDVRKRGHRILIVRPLREEDDHGQGN